MTEEYIGESDAKEIPADPTGPITLRQMRIESAFRQDTRHIPRWEREKFANFLWNTIRLDWGPKITIGQIVGPQQKDRLDASSEPLLKSVLDYYRKRDNRGDFVLVLKFYSAHLLQLARSEREPNTQFFLLFKAMDLLRMIVQHSPYSVNEEAETLVFAILTDLGTQRPQQFRSYYDTEQIIFGAIKRLQVFPGDHGLRERLAQQLVAQTSFYDAVVHYQFLVRYYPRIPLESDTRRGRAFLSLAKIFQDLADHAGKHPGDSRKLRNFIERYNRDYAAQSKQLPLPRGDDAAQVQMTARRLLPIADQWYIQALNVRRLGAHRLSEAAELLVQNYQEERKYKEALKVLIDVKPQWKQLGASEESWELRLKYADLMTGVAMKLQRRDILSEIGEEQREYRAELDRMQQARQVQEDEEEEFRSRF